MHVGAETPKLNLLALARLDGQGISVDPFVGGYVGGLGSICKDIEHGRFVDDR